MSMNHVSISGNLTRDAELFETPAGMAILNFSVAVNDRTKNAEGEWVDTPNFVDCVLFGKRADALFDFMTKGVKVAISGKLRYSAWEKDGVKRSKLEVVTDEIELFVPKREATEAEPEPEQKPTKRTRQR